MSKTILLNHSNWHFTKENPGIPAAVMGETVALPHTWNAVDGQDGGNDYYRGTCWYTLALTKPAIPAGGKAVLQLDGAAMTAVIYLNGEKLAEHKGGYSTFRVDLTDHLKDENLLAISVDNRDNDTVYPQKADFTFYGGIYRDVTLHIVPAEHFALPANGAPALKVTPIVTDLAAKTVEVTLEAAVVGAQSVSLRWKARTSLPRWKTAPQRRFSPCTMPICGMAWTTPSFTSSLPSWAMARKLPPGSAAGNLSLTPRRALS